MTLKNIIKRKGVNMIIGGAEVELRALSVAEFQEFTDATEGLDNDIEVMADLIVRSTYVGHEYAFESNEDALDILTLTELNSITEKLTELNGLKGADTIKKSENAAHSG